MKKILTWTVTTSTVVALAALGTSGAGASPGGHPHGRHPDAAKARASASRLVARRPHALHSGKYDAFRAGRVIASAQGLQYVPYQRTYRGLPVVGGDFVVTTDADGKILDTSVAQSAPVSLTSLARRLPRARAEKIAVSQLDRGTLESGTRAVVLQQASSHLAWEVTVHGTKDGEPSRLSVYVDARDGRVLATRQHVADGTGTGAYNGPSPLSFGTTHSGSSYTMTDPNLANTSCQDAATNRTLTGTDDVWGNGLATDKETACVDALFVADTEKAMLAAWDGRNGMDGNGGAWPIRIGLNDENAYYDGTQVQIGHNSKGAWIPSLDVLGHEMGHGVDDHTPGGLSGQGTQEFVADTFGAATEWYAKEPAGYDTPDFTVGEAVNLVGNGPIRYMYDPSLAGHDNCYSTRTASEEVHAAAGPGNHWFYLVAEGTKPTDGQPTSPTCNNSSVSGIGIKKAEQVMYNAMLMKTSRSSYLTYRTWTLKAAKNLYPGSCTEFATVKAAWDAVSVPAQSGDPTCSTS